MEATAKVIPWSGKAVAMPGKATVTEPADTGTAFGWQFGPLEEIVIMIPDDQLDALGSIFAASPLRKAMTFEGYLIAKGFGQPVEP